MAKQFLVVEEDEDEGPPIFETAKSGPTAPSGGPSASGTKKGGKENPFSFFSFKKEGQPTSSDPLASTQTTTATKKTKATPTSNPAKPPSRRISDLEQINIFDDVPSLSSTTKKSTTGTTPAAKTKALRPPPPPSSTNAASIFDDPDDPLFGNLGPSPSSSSSSSARSSSERLPKPGPPPIGLRGGLSVSEEGSARDFGIGDGSELDKELRKKKAKEEENPFSFKNFAKGKGTSGEGDDKRKEGNNNATSSGATTNTKHSKDQEEPATGGDNPYSFKAFAVRKKEPVTSGTKEKEPKAKPVTATKSSLGQGDLALPVFGEDEDEGEHEKHLADLPEVTAVEISMATETAIIPLPAVALPSVNDLTNDKKLKRSGGNGASDDEVRTMRRQIEELQERLRRSEAAAAEEASKAKQQETRARKAEKAVARLKKKEEEETQQLNSIVQAVERNLLLATARAEKAEQRIKELEVELHHARSSASSSGGVGMGNGMASSPPMKGEAETVREQATFAMSEMHRAANEAEEGVKKLMSGVNTLREIAATLSSIQKFSLSTDA